MTAGVVLPIVPQTVVAQRCAGADARRGPLPLPPARPAAVDGCLVCGVATLDSSGRMAEAIVVAALGWGVGTRLDIRVRSGLMLITADPHAVFRITRPGQVRITAAVRDWCGLAAGDRVLLTADVGVGLLVVHPPAILAAMVGRFHAVVLGGEAE